METTASLADERTTRDQSLIAASRFSPALNSGYLRPPHLHLDTLAGYSTAHRPIAYVKQQHSYIYPKLPRLLSRLSRYIQQHVPTAARNIGHIRVVRKRLHNRLASLDFTERYKCFSSLA